MRSQRGFLGLAILWASLIMPLKADAKPSAPTDLRVEFDGSAIQLSWKASPLAAGYNVFYSVPGEGKENLCNAEPITSPQFSLKFFGPQGIYHFFVRAIDAGSKPQESESSNICRIEVPPLSLVLKKTKISTNGYGAIDIAKQEGMAAWGEPSKNGLKGYNVYLSDGGVTFGLLNQEPLENVTSYIVPRLELGRRYYFLFTSIASDGTESGHSKVVSFVAKPVKSGSEP